ncbi:larval cuticle protein A2B-like [Episyrphus balteatus]|uniref:larval cuticle protein A2B-like n=1 Tax=Episyrphus balteatus TaxID=286459 RepID=UPI0024860E93|nr:larval cuticle protein A2B-like [Episyrphus balteatus]
MAFKICVLLACIALARAGLVPSLAESLPKKSDLDDPHPQYTFGYDVQDAVSGDSKNQYETRDGDLVRGQYSLVDADGFRRIVDYTADPEHGFNAVVRKEPLSGAVKEAVATPLARQVQPAPVPYSALPALQKTQQSPPLFTPASNAIVKTTFTSPISSYTY